MATEKIADLRRLTPKLREAESLLKEKIQQESTELEESKNAVARGEIELSLIHDAFFLKFGQIGENGMKDAIQAMDNLNQIEVLEIELSHELSRAKQAEAEVERISALAPSSPVEEIDLQSLLDQENELSEKISSLKIRNGKREKNIRLAESKIATIDVEINELSDQLKERRKREEIAQQQSKVAEQLKTEIKEIASQIKEKNKEVKERQGQLAQVITEIDEIDDLIEENQEIYKQKIDDNKKLNELHSKLSQSNEPMLRFKSSYDEFSKKASNYREKMSKQLSEINSLIDVLKAEMEQNSDQ